MHRWNLKNKNDFKEERLERIYQSYNKDADPNEKNDDDQIHAHEVGPELQFTGR